MKNNRHILILMILILCHFSGKAIDLKSIVEKLNAACTPGTSSATLDINRVRYNCSSSNGFEGGWKTIRNNTDTISNLVFAQHIWFGGIDAGKQLKSAAMTYRQSTVLGVSYWPGPLNSNGGTNKSTCNQYDRVWKISKADIEKHKIHTALGSPIAGYTPPADFLNWPAYSPTGSPLAPYYDKNGDGMYNPTRGDYPIIQGDQATLSLFNDQGNYKFDSSSACKLEVIQKSYAFNTQDAVGDAVFVSYQITYRGSSRLDSCYLGLFTDGDIGNPSDDYSGCDPSKNFSYFYNADANDDGIYGFGINPPALGIDLLNGPTSDPNNGFDDDGDGKVDEMDTVAGRIIPERFNMTGFVTFNNSSTPIGNTTNFQQVYNYMRGFWGDGVRIIYGGNGYPGSLGSTTTPSSLMFTSYPWTNGWSMASNPNNADDKRSVMSCGAFTMRPGEVKFVEYAVFAAQANKGGHLKSLKNLVQSDEQIQAFYDNNFKTSGTLQSPTNAGSSKKPTLSSSLSMPTLYPNPFKQGEASTLTISQLTPNSTISIYNLNGSVVCVLKNFAAEQFEWNGIQTNGKQVTAGLYVISIQSENGTVSNQKWIVAD